MLYTRLASPTAVCIDTVCENTVQGMKAKQLKTTYQ